MKSGFVAIVGKPNVGKSTILNAIIGSKISIVTSKNQTTRNSIQGIYNDDDSQIVFIDTPGIHKPRSVLGEMMDKASYSSIRDCDIALFIVDASKKFDEGDQYLFDHLNFDCKLIVVFNKIDETNIELITELKQKYKDRYNPINIIETSAIEEFGLNDLINAIKENLDDGPQYYDVHTTTNMDLAFRIQEIIREKMLVLLKEEVPHSTTVICTDIIKDTNPLEIYCKIIVEKESQKSIVIGAQGKMIKKIGIRARHDIEYLMGRHIDLKLFVQVVENWRNSNKFLAKTWFRE